MAPLEARRWSKQELRDLIAIEVSTGNTMRALISAISSGELTAGVQAIATAANSQVFLLAAQVKTNATRSVASWETAAHPCNRRATRARQPNSR